VVEVQPTVTGCPSTMVPSAPKLAFIISKQSSGTEVEVEVDVDEEVDVDVEIDVDVELDVLVLELDEVEELVLLDDDVDVEVEVDVLVDVEDDVLVFGTRQISKPVKRGEGPAPKASTLSTAVWPTKAAISVVSTVKDTTCGIWVSGPEMAKGTSPPRGRACSATKRDAELLPAATTVNETVYTSSGSKMSART